ncbi:MAG TPA: SPASM domain-containing protein, partial [Bacillota bacterium]|nr:SPASM domain-containing protein [Bacillota bacterium]
ALGISLDSISPRKHDYFRGLAGAWQQTVAGMNTCRKAGLPFQIHTTVTDWNQDEIEALTDFAVRVGARAHHLFFLIPAGRAVKIEEHSLPFETYERLLKQIITKQKSVNIELKPTCAPQFMRVAKQLNVPNRFNRGCLAGTGYCIITPIGNVQPCAYLETVVGNVREHPFDDIWRDSPVFQRLRSFKYEGGCGRCHYQKICGGCRARANYYNGDYMGEDPLCHHHLTAQQTATQCRGAEV